MLNRLTYILIVIALVFNVLLVLKYANKSFELQKKINSKEFKIINLEAEMLDLASVSDRNLNDFHKYNYLYYDKDIEILSINNEVTNLIYEVNNQLTLVYRITETVCNICYDEVIKELKKYEEIIGSNNLVILVPLLRLRELKKYLNDQEFNVRVFGIQPNGLGIEIEENSNPFIFVIDQSKMYKHVFIPPRNNIGLTSMYLDLISERYFQNNYKKLCLD